MKSYSNNVMFLSTGSKKITVTMGDYAPKFAE